MIELRIDSLVMGGRGIGRLDGKAVFVPGVLPGETVRCRIVRDHKRHSEAEPVAVVDSSPERCAPFCPVFGECGGCQWQHMPIALQKLWKDRLFREALLRHLPLSEEVFHPLVASPAAWHYRCRAQVKCRMTREGFVAGFYRAGSHFVVDIADCPLLAPELNRLLPELKSLLSRFPRAHRVPQVDLAVDDDRQLSIIVHCLDDDPGPLRQLLAPLAAANDCSVHLQSGRKETLRALHPGPEQVIRPAGAEMTLAFPPGGFVQVNPEQNRRLVAAVVDQVGPGDTVLDLYCGIGNFSLPAARKASRVLGIEDYAPAIASAVANAGRNAIDNADFIAAPAESALRRHWGESGFDTVLLDPPRSGAYDVARQLPELAPGKIVYVSCDPMTLARDLTVLLHNGYRAVRLQAFDMFPQTAHIEALAVLERR